MLTDLRQGSKCNPTCDDKLPLDLVVIKEPPHVLASDDISDVSPSNVEEAKECESKEMCT